jgi:hypothetical protein
VFFRVLLHQFLDFVAGNISYFKQNFSPLVMVTDDRVGLNPGCKVVTPPSLLASGKT